MFLFLFSSKQTNNYSAATSPLWSVQNKTKPPLHHIALLPVFQLQEELGVSRLEQPSFPRGTSPVQSSWRRKGLNLPCSLGDHIPDYGKVTKVSLRERSFILKDNINPDRSTFCCFSRGLGFLFTFIIY